MQKSQQLDFESIITELVEAIRSVKEDGRIRILCGEGEPRVYNDQRVMDAFEFAKNNRNARTEVNTSPFILIEDGWNGLIKSQEKGYIDVYCRPQRGAMVHFKTIETDQGYRFYPELPHRVNAPTEDRNPVRSEVIGGTQFWATSFNEFFDEWSNASEKIGGEKDEKPYIEMTREMVTKLIQKTDTNGNKSYDFIGLEDVRRI